MTIFNPNSAFFFSLGVSAFFSRFVNRLANMANTNQIPNIIQPILDYVFIYTFHTKLTNVFGL